LRTVKRTKISIYVTGGRASFIERGEKGERRLYCKVFFTKPVPIDIEKERRSASSPANKKTNPSI